eukprot:GEMP01023124.1.p1 GENE.GEMP01023124.1~~GEMP01023124.1.p1  ORF type:complete len:373 (+),score=119.28 GEMP01023124.1:122-1240(+)
MSSPSSVLSRRRRLLPCDGDAPLSPSSKQSPSMRSKASGDIRVVNPDGVAMSSKEAPQLDGEDLSGILPGMFEEAADGSSEKTDDVTPLARFLTFASFAVDRKGTKGTASTATASSCWDPFPNREKVDNEYVVNILGKAEREKRERAAAKLAAIEAARRAKEEAEEARVAAIEAERRAKEEAEVARIAAIEAEKQEELDAEIARVAAEERAVIEAEEAEAARIAAIEEEERVQAEALAAAEAESARLAALEQEELDKINEWLVAQKFLVPSDVAKDPKAAKHVLNGEAKQRAKCRGGKARYPLHVAVMEDDLTMVRLMLAHGADATLTRGKLQTPLQFAKAQKKVNPLIVHALLDSVKSKTEEKDFDRKATA